MLGRFAAQPPAPPQGPKGFDDYEVRLGDMMRGERATLGKSLLDVERELRIKSNYLAAIEDGNLAAFDTPSFIAGYVRSYARFLGLNPDDCFVQFCGETGFVPAHGLSPDASTAQVVAVRAKNAAMGGSAFNPAGRGIQSGGFRGLEPGALGSIAVLVAVLCGLGYGGLSLLRQVQMVQLSPIDQTPAIVVDVPSALQTPNLAAPNLAAPDLVNGPRTALGTAFGTSIDPVALAGTATTRLPVTAPLLPRDERAARTAQPRALDVPILIARDGPISAIDPRNTGALATPDEQVQVVSAPQMVEVLAVRPSWVSITAADGTVLFEKILDAGERYAVPALEVAPRLKAGNSSAVYFVMGDQTFGPASRGPEVVRNVDLSVSGVQGAFDLADLSLDADLTSFVAQNVTGE